MAQGTLPESDMNESWRQLGIRNFRPGFYDDPEFRIAENNIFPNLLDVYAEYVATARFPQSYVAKAKRIVPEICDFLFEQLVESRSRGECLDVSQLLSRFLDEEGIWNFVVAGGFRVQIRQNESSSAVYSFPPRENRELHIFEGHGWVVAPPYRLVDLTAWLQNYPEDLLPTQIGPILREDVLGLNIELFPEYPRRSAYAAGFSTFGIEDRDAVIQYTPYATRPSPESLKNLTKPEFAGGRVPLDLFRQWTEKRTRTASRRIDGELVR